MKDWSSGLFVSFCLFPSSLLKIRIRIPNVDPDPGEPNQCGLCGSGSATVVTTKKNRKTITDLFGVGADNGGHPELEIVLFRHCRGHLNQLTLIIPASFQCRRGGGRGKAGGRGGGKVG